MIIKNSPTIEGCELDDVPEIVTFATLQKSRQTEGDERRTPGEQAVLEVRRRVVATRYRCHGGVQVVAHRR